MEQKNTQIKTVKIVANVDPALLRKIDAERIRKGSCSRAAIIRMALQSRYRMKRSIP